MKTTIVNTLVLILIFNLIMIIFPEGKTQKFCRISIKLLIIIFVLDNIFLNGSMNVNLPERTQAPSYEREVNINSISPEIIDTINNENFQGEEVISNISLSFTKDMEMSAYVYVKRILGSDEINKLKLNIAEIFQLKTDNIDIGRSL